MIIMIELKRKRVKLKSDVLKIKNTFSWIFAT